ncbi:hypothetical protein Pan216_16780 [Planctomycetes bacterium Pan216]|uniref:Glycosyltransferase RgtA/B/C/D-like domain-containing protein n=1 Tax=Kolteria novifilia TaxID=2527975 RepID=A0A518B1M4_9BACT|nr:hypothetical protein Pan216_16780 [Planctomycetes bacterium Pan216]
MTRLGPMEVMIAWGLWAGLLSLFVLVPHRRLSSRGRATRRFLLRPVGASLVVALTSLGVCLTIALARWPVPRVHDEFSYLLMAETFASGRLVNPPCPFPEHFESPHILFRGCYASKYPPAAGLFLALGRVATGMTLVGVWIGYVIASLALLWMLWAWLPPRWALVGTMLFTTHANLAANGMFGWSNTYWGGAPAMIGGALLFGALRRLLTRERLFDSFAMGVGVALLANTRPFEGFLATLAAMVPLAISIHSAPRLAWRRLARITLPAAAVLFVCAGAMGIYHRAVTGSMWKLPYQVHEETYGAAPIFVFQGTGPIPDYPNPRIRDFHVNWTLGAYRSQRTWKGYTEVLCNKLSWAGRYYFPSGWLLALLLSPLGMTTRWGRFAGVVIAGILAICLQCIYLFAHYFAPVVGLLAFLVALSLRRLFLLRTGEHSWRKTAVLLLFLMTLSPCLELANGLSAPGDWVSARMGLRKRLSGLSGKHLVLVRYPPDYPLNDEWVYNGADLEGAKVLWAHDLGPERNADLMRHFADRAVWIVIPAKDDEPPTVIRHDRPSSRAD